MQEVLEHPKASEDAGANDMADITQSPVLLETDLIQTRPLRLDENNNLPPKPGDDLVNAWSQAINSAYGKRVEAIMDTGDKLIDAKAELGRGRWGLLFVGNRLPFSQRRAEMFMQITTHPALHSSKFVSDLPASWSVLLLLSRLPAEFVEKAIADQRIHSKMTLAQARDLTGIKSSYESRPQTTNSKPTDYVFNWIRELAHYIDRNAPGWPTDFRGQLASLLRQIAEALVPSSSETNSNVLL